MSTLSNTLPPSTPTTEVSSRYPDLGLGRVPLHKRGKSHTYERLEDLLREAGYKETRIITPEGHHEDGTYYEGEEESPTSHKGLGKMGVGAVVEFLTGLLPSASGPGGDKAGNDAVLQGDFERKRAAAGESVERRSSSAMSPNSPSMSSVSSVTQRPLFVSGVSGHETPRTTISSLDSFGEPTVMCSPSRSGSGTPVPHNRSQSPYQSPHITHRPQHQAVYRVSNHHGPTQGSPRGFTRPALSRTSSLHIVNELPEKPVSPMPSLAHPRPSRAAAYLRRMASRTDVPQRPSSTPVRPQPRVYLNDSEAEIRRRGRHDDDDDDDDDQPPPLPQSWLETVARAVLFGGPGAYAGGVIRRQRQHQQSDMLAPPSPYDTKQDPRMTAKAKMHVLRPTRSSISQVSQHNWKRSRQSGPRTGRSSLTDVTNLSRGQLSTRSGVASPDLLSPPQLFLRIERGRAGFSESQVCPTRVYCRSAPGSRATSVVRGGDRKAEKGFMKSGQVRGRGRGKKDRVPSLARTRAEGDMWARPKKRKMDEVKDGYSGGWRRGVSEDVVRLGDRGRGSSDATDEEVDGDRVSSEDEDDMEDDEDDEDGELNLARLLVPAKRQNSIMSLRRHLALSTTTTATTTTTANTMMTMATSTSPVVTTCRDYPPTSAGVNNHKGVIPAATMAASTRNGYNRYGSATPRAEWSPEEDEAAAAAQVWRRGLKRGQGATMSRRGSSEDDEDGVYVRFLK
ncbi:hypothetical protein AMATHDRAFT_50832 [Amanita thiersii Skay4041]|uniref:Uncharacterized protein n=1 Tax=Amanita thiersii Skay4041 TaxID=703135 RepID=A0A2A9NEQ3_9AGAR|nr:hypothetical protein AMATHDRAFT_50832 [Amanita thiersii Skay4041]